MTIAEQLQSELHAAIKAKDRRKTDAIRSIQTEAAKAKAEPGFTGDADDEFYQRIVASYSKRMDKARQEYVELGGRGEEMAAKLAFEIDYLSQWGPQTLDEAETKKLVAAAIAELGATEPKDAGRVTGHLMKSHNDLDGGLVNRLVREELESQ